ncbi:GNAT family N-acetyltransferase [Planctomycetota bacterium]
MSKVTDQVVVFVHDKNVIEGFLRGDPLLHLYGLGDLDDFFFPHTCWFGLTGGTGLRAIVLLYAGLEMPTVIALSDRNGRATLGELVRGMAHLLPRRFYAHLSPGLAAELEGYELLPRGRHLKMALTDRPALDAADTSRAVRLGPSDIEELHTLYARSYPGNWFDRRMLETHQYFGVREHGELVAAGGVHVFSPRYRVCALGNVTAQPELRGRGLGTAVTAAVCKSVLETVDHIGLNVKADNVGAVRCYRRLGFSDHAEYGEFVATAR